MDTYIKLSEFKRYENTPGLTIYKLIAIRNDIIKDEKILQKLIHEDLNNEYKFEGFSVEPILTRDNNFVPLPYGDDYTLCIIQANWG